MAIHIETSIWINRSVGDVFAFVTEPSNFATYIPGLREAHFLTDGERGIGSKVGSKISILGANMDITAEWTSFKRDAELGSKNIDGMPVQMLCTFHVENGGTRIDRVLDMQPQGFFGSLSAPIVRRTAQRNSDIEFATLKGLLEN